MGLVQYRDAVLIELSYCWNLKVVAQHCWQQFLYWNRPMVTVFKHRLFCLFWMMQWNKNLCIFFRNTIQWSGSPGLRADPLRILNPGTWASCCPALQQCHEKEGLIHAPWTPSQSAEAVAARTFRTWYHSYKLIWEDQYEFYNSQWCPGGDRSRCPQRIWHLWTPVDSMHPLFPRTLHPISMHPAPSIALQPTRDITENRSVAGRPLQLFPGDGQFTSWAGRRHQGVWFGHGKSQCSLFEHLACDGWWHQVPILHWPWVGYLSINIHVTSRWNSWSRYPKDPVLGTILFNVS